MGLTETDAVKQAMLDIKLVTEFCGIEEEKEIIPQVFLCHAEQKQRVFIEIISMTYKFCISYTLYDKH